MQVRTARGGRAALLVVPLLAVPLALAACGDGTSEAGPTVSAVTPSATSASPAAPTTTPAPAPTTASATTKPGKKTPKGTRTVYAGTRTSTLVPWDEPSVAVRGTGPTPSAAAGAANLKIMLDDGFGIRAYWTLTCDPVGGSHPDPTVACGVLGANGAKAFRPSPAQGCDEQYGGPQKALVTGTWRGTKVRSQFTLENGCEVARWTSMIGVLPPGGV